MPTKKVTTTQQSNRYCIQWRRSEAMYGIPVFLHWYALNFNITFKVQEMLYFLHFMKVITLLIAISVVDEIVYKTFTSLNNLIWNRECEEISESIANINLTLFTFSCLMSTAKILNQQELVIYPSTTNVINCPSL